MFDALDAVGQAIQTDLLTRISFVAGCHLALHMHHG